VRRHQHRAALYLWNMSPGSGLLLEPDYTCIPNLFTRCLAFQDHPTFYSNLDVFPYQISTGRVLLARKRALGEGIKDQENHQEQHTHRNGFFA
jgi:hypothetical protein